jgi:hypothetical protein
MTNERKHSPLPWHNLLPWEVITYPSSHRVVNQSGYIVIDCFTSDVRDLKFITLACNSFYDMREALAKMIEEFGYQSDRIDGTQSEGRQRVLSDAHGALRKAGAS